MISVCLYFKVHQPYRLKPNDERLMGQRYEYEDSSADEQSINYLADYCYLPANVIINDLICQYAGNFRVSYSISGIIIELLQKYRPDVIASFQQLVDTDHVELLGETYYHSLSSLHSKKEFQRQVIKHSEVTLNTFGVQPRVFRNTELIHNNQMANDISRLGFNAILCEGQQRILKGRSANKIYQSPSIEEVRLFLRSASLSDDIAFRFDDVNWDRYPLTADKFAGWIHEHPVDDNVINIMLDYETFGIHKKANSGIFDFLKALPQTILADNRFTFSTPSLVLKNNSAGDTYDVPSTSSWEDANNSAGAWFEMMRQNNTLKKIYSLERMVLESGNQYAIETWGRLQAAEYFYYMSEESIKAAAYKYHNPFSSATEAFQDYCNIVADFEIGLIEKVIAGRKRKFSRASIIN